MGTRVAVTQELLDEVSEVINRHTKLIDYLIEATRQQDLRIHELEILVQDLYDKVHGWSQ